MNPIFIKYIEQVFDAFQDGIWISDWNSTCLFVNRKYEELSGFSKEWMIGRKATSIVAEGIFDVAVNPDVIKKGEPVTRVQTLSNGRLLSLNGYPIFDSGGNVVMCITFIHDISTISKLEEKLSRQKDLLNTLIRINNAAGLRSAADGDEFIASPAMEEFIGKARRIADTDVPVLILGETGVGKDVMAKRVHSMSSRADHPFIKVDCGSISSSLIESELFGYVGGAFSGASRGGRIGLIEAAAGGTVFFDEIGELPLPLQTRLLRFLQEGVVVRVGANTPRKVDARVLAATNKDLEKAVAEGTFRSDLYYRLKIAVLSIPPLRERREDIPLMAEFFFRYFSRRYNRPMTLSDEAMQALLRYDWPGNVRELKNMMQEVVVTCSEQSVLPEHLSLGKQPVREAAPAQAAPEGAFAFDGRDYHEIMRGMECSMLKAAIARCDGNMAAASRLLKMDRSTMFRKIRDLEKHGFKVLEGDSTRR